MLKILKINKNIRYQNVICRVQPSTQKKKQNNRTKKNLKLSYFCISVRCIALTFCVLGSPRVTLWFPKQNFKENPITQMERKVLYFHHQSGSLAQKYVNYCFEERQHIPQSPLSNRIKAGISLTQSLKVPTFLKSVQIFRER